MIFEKHTCNLLGVVGTNDQIVTAYRLWIILIGNQNIGYIMRSIQSSKTWKVDISLCLFQWRIVNNQGGKTRYWFKGI